jgi:TonB family protein
MKTVSKLILLISLFAAPLALLAKTPEEAYLETYKNRTDTPVPVKVVTPRVASDYAGTAVKLEFTIDGAGLPRNITVLDSVPAELANSLTVAVAGWKFQPLFREGKAISTKVVLPVRIVDELGYASKFALN